MPDWDPEANDLFLRATEIPAPADRQRFLDEVCAGKRDLRDRVERLLRAAAEAGSFLEQPAADPEATLARPQTTTDKSRIASTEPGTVIGRYKLLAVLGEGGMGTVWLAEQTEPVRRKVALKVVKSGMDGKQVLARFEAERQALALMDHPNIARVLDGGATADGRPYFAMELVKGVPITRYCDDHRLAPRQRLELFLTVCQAVQHAHQKGVIHRDIKPSNVLVAPYDGKPVVKVIDFGIAKAAGQPLTDKTLFTGVGAVIGTPEYMSPEQAELNNADIDTRSDVFSLGVLLYELLTGTTPLTRKRLKEAALLEVLRLVREEEPPRPSTRLSSTDELPSVAANRGLEPRRLTGLVRGELDWVVMKSLEKERNRRYESANGLAADLQRYLNDESVQACPPSTFYRWRKFARRNRAALTAVVLVAVALVAGTAVSTWQAVRATRAEAQTGDALTQMTAARSKTEEALAEVTAGRLKTEAALGAETAANARAREALDALTDDVVQTMFARQPTLDESEKAFLRKVLGFYEPVTTRLGETAGDRFLRSKGYYRIAYIQKQLGENLEAESAYRQAALLLEQLADAFPEAAEYRQKLAQTYNQLGIIRAELGNAADAETALNRARAVRTALADKFPNVPQYQRELAIADNDRAAFLQGQKQPAKAKEAYREALHRLEKLVDEADAGPVDHQLLARTRSNLGQLLREEEKYDDAEKLYRQAVNVQEQNLDKSPTVPKLRRELADSYQGMAILFAVRNKGAEAEAAFNRALALRKKLVEEYPGWAQYRLELAKTYLDLGTLLRGADRLPEAESAWLEARQLWERLATDAPQVPDYHNDLAGVLGRLAAVRQERKDSAGAVALLERARLHHQAALKISPKNPTYSQFRYVTLVTLARQRMEMTDHAPLAAAAEELVQFGCDPANDTFNAAICLCRCVALVGRDAQLTAAEGQKLAGQYTDRAMALLQRAAAHGYKNPIPLKLNPVFGPLRERDEFKKLLAELEKNADT